MIVKLSGRLGAVAALVTEGAVLADVGTDHGYVPIYLLKQKRISRAIAMDINEGPLVRAREHIRLFGMENYIETRRSDGVSALDVGEAQSILIAGMGGGLMIHILKEGETVCKAAEELVLQPQSELERLRRYLVENGYKVLAEDIVSEEGKFYPMMRIRYAEEENGFLDEEKEFLKLSYRYGGLLLKERHPVLKDFLQKEQKRYGKLYERLMSKPDSGRLLQRRAELLEQIDTNRRALAYYEETSA